MFPLFKSSFDVSMLLSFSDLGTSGDFEINKMR